jgi:hypothetical protein
LLASDQREDAGCTVVQESSDAKSPKEPDELQRLVSQHKQEIAKLVESQEKQEQALLKTLRSDLKELQDKYTRKAFLDEAVATRDCLRRLNEQVEFVSILNTIKKEADSLPDDAATAINSFTDPAEKLIDARKDSLRGLQVAQQEKLTALFEKYTKAADLDSALAVRRALSEIGAGKIVPAATKTAPIEAKAEPKEMDLEFPRDFESAEHKYKAQAGWLQQNFREQTDGLVRALDANLKSEQDRATRAGMLDDAVLVRELVKSLEVGPWDSNKLVLLKDKRSRLSADGQKAVDEFLRANQQVGEGFQKEMKRLNEAFAPTVEALIKAALKEGDEAKSGQLMDRHSSLLNLTPMILHRHQKPAFSAEALELIEPFEAATELRKKTCVDSELPLRNRLVEGLRGMVAAGTNQGADLESKALTSAIEFFTADYTDGPQRGRLFVPDSHFPAAAVELFNEYCRDTLKIEQNLVVEQATAAKALVEELRPVREQHVEARQYLEAWTILARGKEFERVLFETNVKFAHVPHWKDHLVDAVVLDVRRNAVLVRQSAHHPNGEWFPRGRIKFAPGDTIAEVKFGDAVPGPGEPVTDKTSLKRGQTVFYVWGRSALEATIVDLTDTSVVLKYKERFHNETVLRTQLWKLTDY